MSGYQVTARKWRPQDFSQVIGQEHVVTALSNAVLSSRLSHAYLFSGPRGVGKTSTARILAKVLNCVESPKVCGQCPACIEIASGQSLDVREIDGASNRGIEQIREIRDNAVYTPLSLKYKIFIIDEVHMLTKEASNALLKVLEEPPMHVIFMLATTESSKILPTIRSRCQHYILKKIPLEVVVERLSQISIAEGYEFQLSALEEIARAGDGSMRDSQTIFDQVALYSQGNLTLEAVREILGIPDILYFLQIIKAVLGADIVAILEQLNTYLAEVGGGISFAENLVKFLRNALLVKKVPIGSALLDFSPEMCVVLQETFAECSEKNILTLLDLALELYDTLRKESGERFWIESTLLKMVDFRNRISLSELRQEIFRILNHKPIPVKESLSNTMAVNTNLSTRMQEDIKPQPVKENKPDSMSTSDPNSAENIIRQLFDIS
ncbi:DNA polymerase-3 subunit gamma/tau [Brevinema andersonii]|uniref:DNA polymerase III subunit gamma/tau n=1 Tax=Brevinema andersonii TaxID=34097 RepID=A0A1I1E9N5_BREAD|nr:DNA polymerase III subunit gamma/tau [Brevinema andersonii]SFB82028.1 DNA polymerase-3 subunit gamma/tau [Brevinema andersonii]